MIDHLPGHHVVHASATRFLGTENSVLLRAIAPHYDVFLTVDRNIPFQQNLKNYPLVFIILHSASNTFRDLLPLVPDVLVTLDRTSQESHKQGDLYEVVPR
ncbi:MAG: hypothetical protein M3014_13020 [Chloroflexota bacterium]|nr:hypothetical protein [Chloroflexota bacterium]